MKDQIEEIKIMFLGDKSVGKTNIISRFENNSFEEELDPTATIIDSKKIVKFNNGTKIKIITSDVSGDKGYGFKQKIGNYLEGIKAILLVYSLDNDDFTYDDLINDWLVSIKEKADKNAIIALVLNKIDKLGSKEFNEKEGKDFADKNDVLFFSTSAKKNIGITELYEGIIRKIKGWDQEVKLEGGVVDEEDEEGEEYEEGNESEEVEENQKQKNQENNKIEEDQINKHDEEIQLIKENQINKDDEEYQKYQENEEIEGQIYSKNNEVQVIKKNKEEKTDKKNSEKDGKKCCKCW